VNSLIRGGYISNIPIRGYISCAKDIERCLHAVEIGDYVVQQVGMLSCVGWKYCDAEVHIMSKTGLVHMACPNNPEFWMEFEMPLEVKLKLARRGMTEEEMTTAKFPFPGEYHIHTTRGCVFNEPMDADVCISSVTGQVTITSKKHRDFYAQFPLPTLLLLKMNWAPRIS